MLLNAFSSKRGTYWKRGGFIVFDRTGKGGLSLGYDNRSIYKTQALFFGNIFYYHFIKVCCHSLVIYSFHCSILKVLVQNFPGIFKTKVHSRCSYVTKQKNIIKALIPHKHFQGSIRILKPTPEKWTERLHCGKSEGHSTTWSSMVFPPFFISCVAHVSAWWGTGC